MKESTKYKIEFFLTIFLILGVLIFKFIPEYKNSLGSSDSFLDTKNYDGIVEIKINDQPDFILVTQKDYISAILFFDKKSLCLYNQNIENRSIEEGINIIVEQLIKNNYLQSASTITFAKYTEYSYQQVQTAFKNKLQALKVTVNYAEIQLTLKDKAISLGIEDVDSEEILRKLELYSKEIVRYDKNNVSKYDDPVAPASLTEESAKELTNNIYRKLEDYATENKVINQPQNSTILPITLIPATSEGTLFPDTTSWYYIKDGRVYAYISLTSDNQTFSYCYQGSIDTYKKGQC